MKFVGRSVVRSEGNDEIVEGAACMVRTYDNCRIGPIVLLCGLEFTVRTRLKVTRMYNEWERCGPYFIKEMKV